MNADEAPMSLTWMHGGAGIAKDKTRRHAAPCGLTRDSTEKDARHTVCSNRGHGVNLSDRSGLQSWHGMLHARHFPLA